MIKKYIAVIVIVILLCISAYLFLISSFNPEQLVSDLISKAAEKNGLSVSYQGIHLSIWRGPAARIDGIVIREMSSGENIITAEKFYIVIKFLPLIAGKVIPDKVILHSPELSLARSEEGEWLLPKFVKEEKEGRGASPFEILDAIDAIHIVDGKAQITDFSISHAKTINISDFELTVKHAFFSEAVKVSLNAIVEPVGGLKTSFQINSKSKLDGAKDFKSLDFDSHIIVTSFNPNDFSPYLDKMIPFEKLNGTLDLDIDFTALPLSEGFSMSGSVSCEDLICIYPKLFLTPLTSRKANIEFSMEQHTGFTNMKNYRAEFDNFTVDGGFSVKKIDDEKTALMLRFSSPEFIYDEDGKRFIPFGIIKPELTNILKNEIKGGKVNLRELTIKSVHINDPNRKNEHGSDFMTLDASFNNMALNFGHTFKQINVSSGNIEIKDGNISFTDCAGTYGKGEWQLVSGGIDNMYEEGNLHIDAAGKLPYSEIKEFLESELLPEGVRKYASKVSYPSGNSSLKLSLKKQLSKHDEPFFYEGDVVLDRGSFNYEGINERINLKEGASHFSNNETELKKITLNTGGSNFIVAGNVKKAENYIVPLCNINISGAVSDSLLKATVLKESAETLNAEGFFRFNSTITGPVGNLDVGANANLTQFSMNYGTSFTKKILSPDTIVLTGTYSEEKGFLIKNSTLVMQGNSYKISGHYNSTVKPRLTLDITAKPLNLSGMSENFIGLKPLELTGKAESAVNLLWEDKNNYTADIDVKLSKVSSDVGLLSLIDRISGKIESTDTNLRFRDFKLKLLGTAYNVEGEILKNDPEREKTLFLDITAKQFDLDKLIKEYPQKKKEEEEKEEKPSDFLYSGKLKCSEALFLDNTYENLSAVFTFSNNKLTLIDVKASGFKGNTTTNGTINWKEKKTSFDICSEGGNVNIKKFLDYLGAKDSDLKGEMYIMACLQSEWENSQDIKTNSSGNISFISKNGVIRKTGLGILSKILSFFNVLSWKDFWIKDVETKGMTYNTITADFDGKDGVFHTENFLLDGSSMKISAVGDLDLKNNKINMIVGVMPLRTLDSIIGKIPIVGYIIMGKDKSLISAYFEVTGDIKNPDVKAIPIKSLGSGIVGLIRRSLGFPYDLIKDMGNGSKKTDDNNSKAGIPEIKQ